MIVLDANVLLHAYDSSSPAHERCRHWLTEAFNGGEQIGLPWQTLLAFVRIATNSRAFRVPLSGERACAIVSQWLTLPQVVVAVPGESRWPHLPSSPAQRSVRRTGISCDSRD